MDIGRVYSNLVVVIEKHDHILTVPKIFWSGNNADLPRTFRSAFSAQKAKIKTYCATFAYV